MLRYMMQQTNELSGSFYQLIPIETYKQSSGGK